MESWNKRIMEANFNGNPALTITIHYLPVEESNKGEEHYNQLSAALKEVLKNNMLVLMRDFNVHLRRDTVKYLFHKSSNSNGKLVHDLAEETGLFVTNTSFQKKLRKF